MKPAANERSFVSSNNKDKLYALQRAPADFVFDENVARVFEDMINRSVPGYSTVISMIALLARQYCKPATNIYDLGCSLGAASLAIRSQIPRDDFNIIAVDNSPAMIESLRSRLADPAPGCAVIQCHCADIADFEISRASVVVLNFTLQFIPLSVREDLMRRIYQGLVPGGILILSEKIRFPDPDLDQLFVDCYHRFKEKMGYSKLEISQKRAALENVLIPEPINMHKERARKAGFKAVDVWFQCFNFASLVACK